MGTGGDLELTEACWQLPPGCSLPPRLWGWRWDSGNLLGELLPSDCSTPTSSSGEDTFRAVVARGSSRRELISALPQLPPDFIKTSVTQPQYGNNVQ